MRFINTTYQEIKMAKKVTAVVKLQLPAGKATPAPPVGSEGTLEMLGKCRGHQKTQKFMLHEMERLGFKGGSVRIGHCQNAAFALELCSEIQHRFPGADVKSYPLRGLCSYYAERGGIMLGFES